MGQDEIGTETGYAKREKKGGKDRSKTKWMRKRRHRRILSQSLLFTQSSEEIFKHTGLPYKFRKLS